jgi:putative FmdB family regulatory protein
MPTYEYRCKKGHTFDVRQSFSDGPVTTCEVCGQPVQRVFHPVAVHFKGSGFYNTDYGTQKRSREKEAAKDNGSSGEGTKKESKDSKSSNGSAPKTDSGASKPKAAAAD